MTHAERGKRVARTVLDEILPRITRQLGPVNLERLAELVESECAGAALEAVEAWEMDLFRARNDRR